jgi:hypothetical protein
MEGELRSLRLRLAIEHPNGSDARSEESAMLWREITAERYVEVLEAVRPTLWLIYGFLRGGEPILHRECEITERILPAYVCFVTWKGKHWEGSEPLTIPEFAELDLSTIGPSN